MPRDAFPKPWRKNSQFETDEVRSLGMYDVALGLNLDHELLGAYDAWEKAGKPGGKFRVLDVGAGKGVALAEMGRLLESHNRKEFQLLSINRLLADYYVGAPGENILPPRGKSERLVADGEKLPFKGKSVHFLVSVFAAPYMKNRISFLREANRTLYPGIGRAFVGITYSPEEGKSGAVREKGTTTNIWEWLVSHGFKRTAERSVRFEKMGRVPAARFILETKRLE